MSEQKGPTKEEAEEAAAEKRNYAVELFAAILLGIATVLGAYAAYQASLWGGTGAECYTKATHKFGDANREMLRAVQEQAFDAVVWIENLKAHEKAATAVAAAEGAHEASAPAEAHEESDQEPTDEERAKEIVSELEYTEDLSLQQKLAKLQKVRTNLNDAIKWADDKYKKRMAALKPADKLEIAKRILGYEKELAAIEAKELELMTALGAVKDDEIDEVVFAAALEKDAKAKTDFDELEKKWNEVQGKINHEFERLAKPLFFESPDYAKKQEAEFKRLQGEANKLMQDGEKANGYGDKQTRTTVIFTIALFFAGMATVLKRFPLKLAFVVAGLAVFVLAVVHMLSVPIA